MSGRAEPTGPTPADILFAGVALAGSAGLGGGGGSQSLLPCSEWLAPGSVVLAGADHSEQCDPGWRCPHCHQAKSSLVGAAVQFSWKCGCLFAVGDSV